MAGPPQKERSRRPTLAIVLLAIGGFVAVPYVTLLWVDSATAIEACSATPGCTDPVALALLVYWVLLGLVTGAVVLALVSAFRLLQEPARHRQLGALCVALAVSAMGAIGLVAQEGFWVLLEFGGWTLFAILFGGIAAILWKPWSPVSTRTGALGGAP